MDYLVLFYTLFVAFLSKISVIIIFLKHILNQVLYLSVKEERHFDKTYRNRHFYQAAVAIKISNLLICFCNFDLSYT